MEVSAGGTRQKWWRTDTNSLTHNQKHKHGTYTHTYAQTDALWHVRVCTRTRTMTPTHICTHCETNTHSPTHMFTYTHAHTPDLCSCKVQISKTEVKKRALKRGNNDTQKSHVRRTKCARKQSCCTNISTLHDLNGHIQQYLADKDSTTVTIRMQSNSIFKV